MKREVFYDDANDNADKMMVMMMTTVMTISNNSTNSTITINTTTTINNNNTCGKTNTIWKYLFKWWTNISELDISNFDHLE